MCSLSLRAFRAQSLAVLCAAVLSFNACSKSNAPAMDQVEATSDNRSETAQVADKAALMTVVADYRAAVDTKNYDQVVALSMPPTFLKYFANIGGLSPDKMRTEIVGQMSAMMEQVESFEYTYDEENISFEKLEDGNVFARMPLDVNMVIGGQTITAKDHNIGFYEDGRWYLVRVSEPELARMFKETYPQFKDTEFATSQMSIAE